jgi:hypothetical protein
MTLMKSVYGVNQLFETIDTLVSDGEKFVSELSKKNTKPFVRNYILHKGYSAIRTMSFLYDVCKARISVDEWERSWESTEVDVTDAAQVS